MPLLGDLAYTDWPSGVKRGSVWLDGLICGGSEASLTSCYSPGAERHTHSLRIYIHIHIHT